MFASAGSSFVLYLLVFFRLRGNITISAGYKVNFHRQPKAMMGRTNAGAYIVTDDQRVESHLTTVAKQMLWHPIAYIVLISPFTVARFSNFSGASIPSAVTIFTAALFVLIGFVNTVLFCVTCNSLDGGWRQRFGIGTMSASRRGDTGSISRRNSYWPRAESRRPSVVLDISVEKEVEVKYSEGGPSPSTFKYDTSVSLSWPTRTYSDRQQAYNDSYHIRHLSLPVPLDEMLGFGPEHELSACGDPGPH